MSAFAENQAKFRDAAMKPFEQLARQNLAMFQAATELMTGTRLRDPKPSDPVGKPPVTEEVDQLRDQLAALQARIDKLQR